MDVISQEDQLKLLIMVQNRYLGPKFWELVPAQMKNVECLEAFRFVIKMCKPKECCCKL